MLRSFVRAVFTVTELFVLVLPVLCELSIVFDLLDLSDPMIGLDFMIVPTLELDCRVSIAISVSFAEEFEYNRVSVEQGVDCSGLERL